MKCRLCKSKKIESIDLEGYYHCLNCDLIFIEQKHIVDSEEEKDKYREHDNTFACEGYVKMFEDIINSYIIPYKDKIETALDFGCGPGPVLAALLEERKIKTDIYDPYFFPDKVYENKKYDLITSTEVFEHLSAPRGVIKLLISHLQRDKYMLIMTLLHSGVDNFYDWWYRGDKTHITFYSQKTIYWIENNFPLEILDFDNERMVLFKKKGEIS